MPGSSSFSISLQPPRNLFSTADISLEEELYAKGNLKEPAANKMAERQLGKDTHLEVNGHINQ